MSFSNSLAKTAGAVAGAALIAGISAEVLTGDHRAYSSWYMNLQLAVCLVFMADFAVAAVRDFDRRRRISANMLFLLLSIPYINILHWCGVTMHRGMEVVVAALPLIRAFVALAVVVQWLADSGVRRLFAAYLFTVAGFTYLSALMFYDYEILVNRSLHGFGDALWWAWMNVTTVGAAIFPVTAVGKVLAVMLPCLGMMFFPVFTLYVTDIYTHKQKDR